MVTKLCTMAPDIYVLYITLLATVSTDNPFTDSLLYTVALERHFDIMISLNIHALQCKTFLETQTHLIMIAVPFCGKERILFSLYTTRVIQKVKIQKQ